MKPFLPANLSSVTFPQIHIWMKVVCVYTHTGQIFNVATMGKQCTLTKQDMQLLLLEQSVLTDNTDVGKVVHSWKSRLKSFAELAVEFTI